jgi:AcrR family transcriptional regulator
MNAAQRLFLARGVARVTIEQITRHAGVAKGTFYLYFSSRDDILAALGDRFAQEHLRRVQAAVSEKKADDWKGKLSAWAEAASFLESTPLDGILSYGWRARREGLTDNIVIPYLAELLRAGVSERAWSIDDPYLSAVFLFHGLHAVIRDAYSKEKHVNRGHLAHRLEQVCFRVVGILKGRAH